MKYEKITHLDLFSGIGGFALAAERVWPNIEHTFVEYDPFCQEVLKKHWPRAEIHGDIRKFVGDSKRSASDKVGEIQKGESSITRRSNGTFILTGGFPCQPFSQAGRRKGTADDRYLWPPMLECIALYRPEWVIAENVAGLATWDNGVVLETVCTDLEKEGYEVQTFVIPACAVGAPHRRDRIWIVAHRNDTGSGTSQSGIDKDGQTIGAERKLSQRGTGGQDNNAPDTSFGRRNEWGGTDSTSDRDRLASKKKERSDERSENTRRDTKWNLNWPEVATALCRVDDGIPRRLDRNPRLKALGNAIVSQVAEEIMRAIRNLQKTRESEDGCKKVRSNLKQYEN